MNQTAQKPIRKLSEMVIRKPSDEKNCNETQQPTIMTYQMYAVTTVITMDNEQLAKHLSWSSHLKDIKKKQNVLQAPETGTEPNCTKYCETSILAPSARNMNERCNLLQLNAFFAEGKTQYTMGPK